MDLTEALKGLTAIQDLLPAIQEQLKERAVQEAVDSGAAVAVRPVSFRHPLKGESDPWFGLAYQDWLKMRNQGFDGWWETTQGSKRAKIMIDFDKARKWLAKEQERQASLRNHEGRVA
jgi:hypothetical protein